MQSWKISIWMLELGVEMVTVVRNNTFFTIFFFFFTLFNLQGQLPIVRCRLQSLIWSLSSCAACLIKLSYIGVLQHTVVCWVVTQAVPHSYEICVLVSHNLTIKFFTRQHESKGSFQMLCCWWTWMAMRCFSLLSQVRVGIGLWT